MFTRYFPALILAASFADASNASAEIIRDWNIPAMAGNWNGARSSLYNNGISLELSHRSDMLANISGGIAKGSVCLMNSVVAVSIDMDKLAGSAGTSVFMQYHVQHGNKSINNYAGSFAGVSNIETGTSTGQFFQAWLQQSFAGDSISALAGLYAIDSEFFVTESSGLFLQPPYGMSAEMAQTGRNGPPIYPLGALAVRARYTSDGFYLQGALTDGVPGNTGNPHGTQISIGRGDGTLAIAEIGYAGSEGAASKTAIGLWRYTARANDLVEVDALGNPLQRFDHGAYILAERTLITEQADSGQGLSGFIRLGSANKDAYQADWSGSIGLNYLGLFDGRDSDVAGIAISTSHASSKYRDSQFLLGSITDSYESVIEATYKVQLQPWLALQPTAMYIINPDMNANYKNAWVIGARFEISF